MEEKKVKTQKEIFAITKEGELVYRLKATFPFALSYVEEYLKIDNQLEDETTYLKVLSKKLFKEGTAIGSILVSFCPGEKIVFDSYENYTSFLKLFDFAPQKINKKSFLTLAKETIEEHYQNNFSDIKNAQERKIFFGVIYEKETYEREIKGPLKKLDLIIKYTDFFGIGSFFSVSVIF